MSSERLLRLSEAEAAWLNTYCSQQNGGAALEVMVVVRPMSSNPSKGQHGERHPGPGPGVYMPAATYAAWLGNLPFTKADEVKIKELPYLKNWRDNYHPRQLEVKTMEQAKIEDEEEVDAEERLGNVMQRLFQEESPQLVIEAMALHLQSRECTLPPKYNESDRLKNANRLMCVAASIIDGIEQDKCRVYNETKSTKEEK